MLGDKTYNGGYGDGFELFYLNNIGQYGNNIADDGTASKTFNLSDATSAADCITCQLGGETSKVEIISIVLNA